MSVFDSDRIERNITYPVAGKQLGGGKAKDLARKSIIKYVNNLHDKMFNHHLFVSPYKIPIFSYVLRVYDFCVRFFNLKPLYVAAPASVMWWKENDRRWHNVNFYFVCFLFLFSF